MNKSFILKKAVFILFFLFCFHAKANYLSWESEPNKITCSTQTSSLWVDRNGIKNCVQYFISNKNTDEVIIQFYGDRDSSAKKDISDIKRNTYKEQLRVVNGKSKYFNKTYILIARLGTYGSSGSSKNKRTLEEFKTINYAIDQLKDKYNFNKIILYGHSGGATVGASLLTLGREDISCAVLTSGTYNYMPREVNRIMSRQKNYDFSKIPKIMDERYDPIFHTENIYRDSHRKLYIVGDARDKNTPFNLQVSFAWKLIKEKHENIYVINAKGRAPTYHNLINPNQYLLNCIN